MHRLHAMGISHGGRRSRANSSVVPPYPRTLYPSHTAQQRDTRRSQPSCIPAAAGALYRALAGGTGSSSLQPGRRRPVRWQFNFFSLLGWLDLIFISLLGNCEPALLPSLLLCCQGLKLLYFFCAPGCKSRWNSLVTSSGKTKTKHHIASLTSITPRHQWHVTELAL